MTTKHLVLLMLGIAGCLRATEVAGSTTFPGGTEQAAGTGTRIGPAPAPAHAPAPDRQRPTPFAGQEKGRDSASTPPPPPLIVTPFKVTGAGRFLSHDLRHAHQVGEGAKGRARARTKRGVHEEGRHDATVHYSIFVDGQMHMIQLEPNLVFLAPHAVLEHRSPFDPASHSPASRLGTFASHMTHVRDTAAPCHHVGRVLNRTGSAVALSTCHGLQGFVKTEQGEYLIEPLKDVTRGPGDPHPHVIYRRAAPSAGHAHLFNSDNKGHQCGASKNSDHSFGEREAWEEARGNGPGGDGEEDGEGQPRKRRRRRRRSVSVERNVEVLVVADKRMIDFYSDEDLHTYILTIMNMVSSIYHDASIGNAVNIIVVRIMLLETPHYEEELEISHSADDTLASFCEWQEMVNPSSEAHPHHHDVAVLLTRHNICSQANAHCSTLGLAEIAGMCQPRRSCNVNEDTGLQIAYTIAHELGHNFGMTHDTSVNGCGTPYGLSLHVMSPHLATDSIPITWSNCSRSQITNFLDRNWGTCLVDEPLEVEYTFPELPPGAMYDADHQCRLAFGGSAAHCDGIEMECQTLWCRVDNRCVTRLEPAAEGTQCGKHKWCNYGKCVTMGERPASIHGSWGQWSPWSGCTRTCGAGVETANRHCVNPAPANGGKYCTGDRRRYRICNTQDCPDNGVSFRAVQCSHFDHKPHKGQNHTWGPVTLESTPCQLHCKPDNEFYSVELSATVRDGTPCHPGTRDMCIHGVCKRISCDWTIEGTAQEDRCGLCHGDGTQCVSTEGFFNVTEGVSYVDVVTFPVGAMKVRVREVADAANYLAIKDKDKDVFYLNGNWVIQWSGEYSAAGMMVYYKRENETESLFLPGPLKIPLTLMLLFQTTNPGLRWEYTWPHENATYTPQFEWHASDWSVCTQTCGGGTQLSRPLCKEKEAGLVEDRYCDAESRPDDERRVCNVHACPAWWWSGPWQPCSVTCGDHGNRRRTVICVRSYGPTEQMALMDSDCKMALKPHEGEECPDLAPCLSGLTWSVGPWIETCRGDPCDFEHREVRCHAAQGRPCDRRTKPSAVRQCGNLVCGNWQVYPWAQCSTTCGEGVQIRDVVCVGGKACRLAEEPGSVRECKEADCQASTSTTPTTTTAMTTTATTTTTTTTPKTLTATPTPETLTTRTEIYPSLTYGTTLPTETPPELGNESETLALDKSDAITEPGQVFDNETSSINGDKIAWEGKTNSGLIGSGEHDVPETTVDHSSWEKGPQNVSNERTIKEEADLSTWSKENDETVTNDDLSETILNSKEEEEEEEEEGTGAAVRNSSLTDGNSAINEKEFEEKEGDKINKTNEDKENKESIISPQNKNNNTNNNTKQEGNVDDHSIAQSINDSPNDESFSEYETAPDEYYEFDPQEGAVPRDKHLGGGERSETKQVLSQETAEERRGGGAGGGRLPSAPTQDSANNNNNNNTKETQIHDEAKISEEPESKHEDGNVTETGDNISIELENKNAKTETKDDKETNRTMDENNSEEIKYDDKNENEIEKENKINDKEGETDENNLDQGNETETVRNKESKDVKDVYEGVRDKNEVETVEEESKTEKEELATALEFEIPLEIHDIISTENESANESHTNIKTTDDNSLNDNDNNNNSISNDYDYSDEYYDYDDDDYDNSNSTSLNTTLPERPTGFVEDKMDLDTVQVIEVRLRRKKNKNKNFNKSGPKSRHHKKRNRKNNKNRSPIKKVKIHTGADAIRVLNKITKKASAKPPLKNPVKKPGEPRDDVTLHGVTDDDFAIDDITIDDGTNWEDESLSSVFEWTIGPWSECSEPCGVGKQTRKVQCHNAAGGKVPPWHCQTLPPPDLQHCNTFGCLNWTLSDFGDCSTQCGLGTRVRSATCPQEGRCHPHDKPTLEEKCLVNSLCVQWVEGPWSMCTKSCEGGYQIRYVKCVDVLTQESSAECREGDRPKHKRTCNANKCRNDRQGHQNHCKDVLDTNLCRRLVHMCTTKFFRIKCCKTCHRRRGR